MRESRGSLGNERMRSAQIQVVTIAEEMGRIQKVPDCSPAQGLPYEIHCLVAGQGVSWSAELEEDFPCSWQWHGDLLLLNEDCFQTKHWGKLEPELWETVAVTRGIQGLAKRRWISLYHTYTPTVCCWVNMAGQNMWIMLLATTMLLSVSMNLTTLGPSLGYHITLLSCLLWLLLTVAVSQNFFVLMTLTVLRSTAQESF
ncbi:tRNA wybutosine-synthesizing protein 2 homolog isoform X1 [Zalophus californianus]|uniref:tRNA wybutosine-synthesizing protein 2 homolog isoform X1 n=1 Tax=Zalophus californianus TaxID=9704 RepID=A0A6J2E9G3_ZALCA|nr:tRNA wybutosine-synthesizing protein 2 homolog isoform X1 [Zalophus californianus]